MFLIPSGENGVVVKSETTDQKVQSSGLNGELFFFFFFSSFLLVLQISYMFTFSFYNSFLNTINITAQSLFMFPVETGSLELHETCLFLVL